MYNLGDILKLINGSDTEQKFIMVLGKEGVDYHSVVLFNNTIKPELVGDTSITGLEINDYEISSVRELANFIVSNNF